MPEENMNQKFRLKKIDKIRNYLIEEINQNELMNKKHKKICRVFNHIEQLLITFSAITVFVSISTFASLVEIAIGIASSTIGLNICVTTTAIKMDKSIIKKKKEEA